MLEKLCNVSLNQDIKWLNSRTIFLTRAGSHSYGTNISTSDEDFRGIAIPPKEYFFGTLKTFDQFELKNPDLTVFNIIKAVRLITECNPNCLELLFTDESDHLYVDKFGQILLDNRDIFLSKLCKERYIGYAKSQLHRMILHRDFITNPPTKKPERSDFGLPPKLSIPKEQLDAVQAEISKRLDSWNIDFEPFSEAQKIWLHRNLGKILAEMSISADKQWECAARTFGCAENFIEVLSKERAYSAKKKEWDKFCEWESTRNSVRYELEKKYLYDTKFALHTIRLSIQCLEILETGRLLVKRPDAEYLLDIRAGKYKVEEIVEKVNELSVKIKLAYDKSKIPTEPNRQKIDEMVIGIVEESLRE